MCGGECIDIVLDSCRSEYLTFTGEGRGFSGFILLVALVNVRNLYVPQERRIDENGNLLQYSGHFISEDFVYTRFREIA